MTNTNNNVIVPALRRLKVDEYWQVQIPVDLRDKFPLTGDKWVEVYFDFSNGAEEFDELLGVLIHEGVLIVTTPE